MSANIWDQRYAEEGWAYGTEPNAFIAEQLNHLRPRFPNGKLWLPAEGEGRNAIYAAQQGWDVSCFDQSKVGVAKTLQQAEKLGLMVEAKVLDINHLLNETPQPTFQVIALAYVHLPAIIRSAFYKSLFHYLSEGGVLIAELFAPEQLKQQLPSGGPKDLSMLPDLDQLREDFSAFRSQQIWQERIHLQEGKYHNGPAEVYRLVLGK